MLIKNFKLFLSLGQKKHSHMKFSFKWGTWSNIIKLDLQVYDFAHIQLLIFNKVLKHIHDVRSYGASNCFALQAIFWVLSHSNKKQHSAIYFRVKSFVINQSSIELHSLFIYKCYHVLDSVFRFKMQSLLFCTVCNNIYVHISIWYW